MLQGTLGFRYREHLPRRYPVEASQSVSEVDPINWTDRRRGAGGTGR